MGDFKVPYENLVERNVGILSEETQKIIRNTCVAVIGVGGVGGLTAILLAKTGYGKIVVADKDKFEVSNLNRQILANINTLGRNKAEVAKEVLTGHNPYVEVVERVADINSEAMAMEILENVDILIVAVDNFETRIRLLRACKQKGIPAILTGTLGWRMFVTTILPEEPDYETLICAPSREKEITDEVVAELELYQREFIFHSEGFLPESAEEMRKGESALKTIAPLVSLTSCAAIAEVVKYSSKHGKQYICPEYFTIDMRTLKPWSMEEVGMKTLMSYNNIKKNKE